MTSRHSVKATLLLGSNKGECQYFLQRAKELISSQVGEICRCSFLLKNSAWGYQSESIFYNEIIEVATSLSPLDLLDAIESIERTMGRIKNPCNWRGERIYTDREIDIDILYYGDLVYSDDRLEIPHPKIGERDFVQVLLKDLGFSF